MLQKAPLVGSGARQPESPGQGTLSFRDYLLVRRMPVCLGHLHWNGTRHPCLDHAKAAMSLHWRFPFSAPGQPGSRDQAGQSALYQCPVRIRTPEGELNTGLHKLGAILGDWVQTGCNAVTNPGAILGPHSLVLPNATAANGLHPAGAFCVNCPLDTLPPLSGGLRLPL